MFDATDERGPFRADWTEDGAARLAAELKRLADDGLLRLVDVAETCLARTSVLRSRQQKLSRWIGHRANGSRWTRLKREEFMEVLAFVNRVRAEQEDGAIHPDAMFFGMSAWFGSDPESLADLRRFARSYTIYRHSLTAPGRVAVGSLEIVVNPATGAVSTCEQYQVQSDEMTSEFIIRGYLGRRRGKYYIFAQHDDGPDTFVQFGFVNKVDRRGGVDEATAKDVVRFSGVLSDIQANTFYSCRFACTAGAPKALGIISLKAVPAATRTLMRAPDIINGDEAPIGYIVGFQ